mgnify:CR=1 FL=1
MEKTAMQRLRDEIKSALSICDNEERAWVYNVILQRINVSGLENERQDHEDIRQEVTQTILN